MMVYFNMLKMETNVVTPELINDWLKYYGDISSKTFVHGEQILH